VHQSRDTAATPGITDDYSVFTTLGLIGAHIGSLDVRRQRHGAPDLQRSAVQLRTGWQPNLLVIEASHTGIALRQDMPT
jgi:hypothetical protein